MKKAKVLNIFFAIVFTGDPTSLRPEGKSVEEDQVREHLNTLNIHWSMGQSVEGASWWHCKATVDYIWKVEAWKKANVTPIFKKTKKEDPGNYRLFRLCPTEGDGPCNPGSHLQIY